MNFAWIDRPVDAIEGNRAAEMLADVLEFEKRDNGWHQFSLRFCLIGKAAAEDNNGNRAPAGVSQNAISRVAGET